MSSAVSQETGTKSDAERKTEGRLASCRLLSAVLQQFSSYQRLGEPVGVASKVPAKAAFDT